MNSLKDSQITFSTSLEIKKRTSKLPVKKKKKLSHNGKFYCFT